MKVRLNKEYTTVSNVDRVKADIAAFRSAFTDNDLLRMFCENVEIGSPVSYGCEVISADVDGWSTDTALFYRTHFSVEMFVYCYSSVCKVYYHIDYNAETGEYTVRDNAVSVDVYERVKAS